MPNATLHREINPILNLTCILVTLITVVILATPYFFLAPAPALMVLGFLWLSRWPASGYYFIIFLIPFGAYRGYKFIQVPWLIALGLLIVVILRYLPKKRHPQGGQFSMLAWLIIFFILNTLSTILSPYPSTAIRNLILFAIGFLFVLLGLVFISKKGMRITLPAILISSISLCSFLAIVGYFFNIPLFAEKVTSGAFKRGLGGTTDPNNLALMIIVGFPFLVYYLFYADRFWVRALFFVLIGINGLGLVTTFSRSGALVLLLVYGILFVAHFKKLTPKLMGIFIGAVGISLILFYFTIPEGYVERQLSVLQATDKSMGRRTSYLYVAWDTIKKNPLLGTGPGTFPDIYARTDYAEKYTSVNKSPRRFAHNSYLEIAVGSGLLGLAAFLFVIGSAMVNFIKAQAQYLRAGELKTAALVKTFRISFTGLCLYLLVFSEPLHKHFLVLLVLSEVVRRYAPGKVNVTP
ncbi:O-antigen ligase family protein [Desulfobacter latus]|uniref:O-antigen ligase family protein n=1 Tax=Desulfobacter latus TaxID=2292 RepID=A0A850SU66_9BACT|nr:O-antigen ligase [Desulfobacter latus]NWH04699.1 O-antigen ligase family protein [Desulfobacter latus]